MFTCVSYMYCMDDNTGICDSRVSIYWTKCFEVINKLQCGAGNNSYGIVSLNAARNYG